MITELEDDLNRCFIYDVDDGYFITYLWVNGINLHVVNACYIKFDQLKVLIAVKPCQLFLDSALHVIYSCFPTTC